MKKKTRNVRKTQAEIFVVALAAKIAYDRQKKNRERVHVICSTEKLCKENLMEMC